MLIDLQGGGHHVLKFYERRARRLIPALATMLILMLSYYAIFRGVARSTLHGLASVVTYVTFGHLLGQFPPGVSHAWTLVVEWEFYLFWPPVFVLLARRGVSHLRIAVVALSIAAVIGVLRPVVYAHDVGNPVTRYSHYLLLFHLAPFRADEILIGVSIGLLGDRLKVPNLFRTLAFLFILWAIVRTNPSDSWLYYGGFTGVSLCAAALVAPRMKTWWGDRILHFEPLVWMGKISYSLYLWSVPVCSEVEHHTTTWSDPTRALLAVALSFALATSSYYLIEFRFRKASRRPLAQAAR
jgi:peptidoglycan/LPS O-acetylase OafA/YrhL